MEKRDARLGVSVEDALAEIEALTAPEPVTVAEFACTPETRQALGDVLSADDLAELDRDLERHEALASINQPAAPVPAHMDLVRRTRDDLKADAAANGWTAQRNRGVSDWRKTPEGRAFRAKEDRDTYVAKILDDENRIPRRNKKATEERRREQKAASKANRSPAQIERERILDNESKARRRADAKAVKTAALTDAAIFS